MHLLYFHSYSHVYVLAALCLMALLSSRGRPGSSLATIFSGTRGRRVPVSRHPLVWLAKPSYDRKAGASGGRRDSGQIIYRGRNRYVIRIDLGRDAAGRRRRHNKTFHGSYTQAQEALRKLLASRDLGAFDERQVAAERRAAEFTVDDLLDEWIRRELPISNRGISIEDQQRKCNIYLRPFLGKMILAALTQADIVKFRQELVLLDSIASIRRAARIAWDREIAHCKGRVHDLKKQIKSCKRDHALDAIEELNAEVKRLRERIESLRALPPITKQMRSEGSWRELDPEPDAGDVVKISASTVRAALKTLKAALNYAVDRGYIAANPADKVKLPKAVPPIRHPLSRDQASRLVVGTAADVWGALFAVLVGCGLRPSEALALCWKDIDWGAAEIRVSRKLTRLESGAVEFEPTKSEAGTRSVHLPGFVRDALEAHRIVRRGASIGVGDDDLVFGSVEGEPVDEKNILRRHLRPALERLGLPTETSLYDLRHTCGTLNHHAGMHLKQLARLMGHSSGGFTIDTYVHDDPDGRADAAAVMDSMLELEGGVEGDVEPDRDDEVDSDSVAVPTNVLEDEA